MESKQEEQGVPFEAERQRLMILVLDQGKDMLANQDAGKAKRRATTTSMDTLEMERLAQVEGNVQIAYQPYVGEWNTHDSSGRSPEKLHHTSSTRSPILSTLPPYCINGSNCILQSHRGMLKVGQPHPDCNESLTSCNCCCRTRMSPRWGIVSAGKISHDFVTAINSYSENEVEIVAIAARDETKAQKFADLHNIKKVFQSYEAMAKSNDIDVAYVGSLNNTHYELSKLFLENGKHVICEKPLCLNQKQVQSLVDIARQKKLFLMEAVWSRFLPSYLALEKELESGNLGEVLFAQANFGIPISHKERIASKEFGGGCILDIGIYVLQFAQFVFKDAPIKVTSSGTVGLAGTDESVSIILDYSGGRRATLNVHGRVTMDNFAIVTGTKGSIKLLNPFHCTERLQKGEVINEYPLHKGNIPFNFVNSGGLAYEAQEVNRCIKNGLIESQRMSHAESLLLAKLEDTVRAQVGVHFDVDKQNF